MRPGGKLSARQIGEIFAKMVMHGLMTTEHGKVRKTRQIAQAQSTVD
jgi:hypothetical protein